MNKIHRIVWSVAHARWVVAAETAKGRRKSTTTKVAKAAFTTALLMVGGIGAAQASTCTDGSAPAAGACQVKYNPVDNDGTHGATVADGGQSVTLTGPASNIERGLQGLYYPTLGTLAPATTGQEKLDLGAKTLGVTTPDAATGGNVTVAAYDTANFATSDWGNQYGSPTYYDVGDSQYIQSRMLIAQGGTGTIDIGDPAQALTSDVNRINMAAKNTNVASALGAGSTVNWSSRNRVELDAGQSAAGTQTRSFSISTPTYAGTFTGFDGQSHTVTNASELGAYNDVLVAALQSGALNSQAAYDNAFKQAVSFQDTSYNYDTTVSAGDEVTQPKGQNFSMYVDGAGAQGKILSGAQIDQYGASVLVVNGGQFEIENGGALSGQGTDLYVQSGSSAVNNGVISAGYFAEDGWDTTGAGNYGGHYVEARAVEAKGAGTTFTNNGIVNVATWDYNEFGRDQYGVKVWQGADATNNGIINVGVNNAGTQSRNRGAVAQDSASFTNSATGQIYVGRAAQYNVDAPEAVVDTVNNSERGAAIELNDTAVGENAGNITIGTKAQNIDAFLIRDATAATAINSGTIDINGRADGAPLPNTGLRGENSGASTLLNSGTINLNGVNGVGVRLDSTGGVAANATSTGTINVAGGIDPVTRLRNYGVWAEGDNANATVSGDVNLTGDGAIGVHARNGGNVMLAGNGAVNFNGGTDQIGYFAYGSGSSITDNSTGAQDVSTQGSTLFRMEDGADFTGGVATASALTASGASSTAVLVSGQSGSDVSAFNSGATSLQLTGQDATGVRVEGGAQGKIDSSATIDLAAAGAVAGVADGQKHDIDGGAVGSPIAGTLNDASQDAGTASFGTGTVLVSDAQLTSSLDGVTGYIARNGAELSNAGDIDFSGSGTTGLRVEAGARGDNTGSITVGAGGTGIAAQDASGIQTTVVNNSGDLMLNGGSVAQRGVGIDASGAQTTVNMTGGGIALNGDGAIGVRAADGATVNLSGSAVPTFSSGASDQILFHLSGAGSTINVDPSVVTPLDASSTRSTVYRVDDGASVTGVVNAIASGQESTAMAFSGAQTSANVAAGSTLDVVGHNARGVYVAGGANVTVDEGAAITLGAVGATAGIVDGKLYGLDGSQLGSNTGSTLTNAATLTSAEVAAVGFVAQDQGKLVNNGAITLAGFIRPACGCSPASWKTRETSPPTALPSTCEAPTPRSSTRGAGSWPPTTSPQCDWGKTPSSI